MSMPLPQRGPRRHSTSEGSRQRKGGERQENSLGSRTTSAGRMVGFTLPRVPSIGSENCGSEKEASKVPQAHELKETFDLKFQWPSTFKRSRASSVSMNSRAGIIGASKSPFRRSSSVSLSRRPSTSGSAHGSSAELAMLFSKSGMGLFRKFLQNKPGERNLLFWLDVEQVKYIDSPGEVQK